MECLSDPCCTEFVGLLTVLAKLKPCPCPHSKMTTSRCGDMTETFEISIVSGIISIEKSIFSLGVIVGGRGILMTKLFWLCAPAVVLALILNPLALAQPAYQSSSGKTV